MPPTPRSCTHCGAVLQPLRLPVEAAYDEPVHLVCFNDDCPYYREGWEWMWQQYSAKASYRYRVEPLSGVASPLPVWSAEAMRDRICVSRDEESTAARPAKRPAKRAAKRAAAGKESPAKRSPSATGRAKTRARPAAAKSAKARGRPQSRGRTRGG